MLTIAAPALPIRPAWDGADLGQLDGCEVGAAGLGELAVSDRRVEATYRVRRQLGAGRPGAIMRRQGDYLPAGPSLTSRPQRLHAKAAGGRLGATGYVGAR
jgi:hypothetical protein